MLVDPFVRNWIYQSQADTTWEDCLEQLVVILSQARENLMQEYVDYKWEQLLERCGEE